MNLGTILQSRDPQPTNLEQTIARTCQAFKRPGPAEITEIRFTLPQIQLYHAAILGHAPCNERKREFGRPQGKVVIEAF